MRSGANKATHVTRGSIFDDLGFSREQAAALKIKATILSALLKHIKQKRYSQVQLVGLLDEYQPNVSNLLNGKISRLSIEKLLSYAYRLGISAEIVMRPAKRRAAA
jgi:predicted XRE-type DNA-binding protein